MNFLTLRLVVMWGVNSGFIFAQMTFVISITLIIKRDWDLYVFAFVVRFYCVMNRV